jgi:predicted transcriptional regulator
MPANDDRTLDMNLGIGEDLDSIDEAEALEGIRRGLADVEAGRVTPPEKFEKDFRKKFRIPPRSRAD